MASKIDMDNIEDTIAERNIDEGLTGVQKAVKEEYEEEAEKTQTLASITMDDTEDDIAEQNPLDGLTGAQKSAREESTDLSAGRGSGSGETFLEGFVSSNRHNDAEHFIREKVGNVRGPRKAPSMMKVHRSTFRTQCDADDELSSSTRGILETRRATVSTACGPEQPATDADLMPGLDHAEADKRASQTEIYASDQTNDSAVEERRRSNVDSQSPVSDTVSRGDPSNDGGHLGKAFPARQKAPRLPNSKDNTTSGRRKAPTLLEVGWRVFDTSIDAKRPEGSRLNDGKARSGPVNSICCIARMSAVPVMAIQGGSSQNKVCLKPPHLNISSAQAMPVHRT